GYTCERNAVRTGRSGGRHEVDVLAETSDGLTAYRVAVECRAQHLPVDKEVVAKLAFVVSDLSLHKGIVVSLRGSRVGAERSAAELGIELWGPAELEQRLGRTAVTGLGGGPTVRLGPALPVSHPPERAARLVRRERRRWFRGGPEAVEWMELVWVPHHLLRLAVAIPGGQRRRPSRSDAGALRTNWFWNLYEALTGTWVAGFEDEPVVEDTAVSPSLPAQRPEATVATWLRNAAQRRQAVVTAAAQQRYAAQLEAFGLPGDAASLVVESTRAIHVPYHLALLSGPGGARIVAVDATTGTLAPGMGEVLTGAIGALRHALDA
ncbi:MAG TPA: restriction endonuclease, partial [Acidimicrobiia bacterium]